LCTQNNLVRVQGDDNLCSLSGRCINILQESEAKIDEAELGCDYDAMQAKIL